jgi:hypothetical protein
MDSQSRLIFRWVVLGTIGFLVAVPGVVAGGLVAQRHAMNRCIETPPGFPKSLSRAGTEVTVDWTLLPPRYTCVYATPGSIVRRPPP